MTITEFKVKVLNLLKDPKFMVLGFNTKDLCMDTSLDIFNDIPDIKKLDPANKKEYNNFINTIRKQFNYGMTLENAKLAAINLKEAIITDTMDEFIDALDNEDLEAIVAYKVWFKDNDIVVDIFLNSLN